ncbi:MAG: tRNA adenosine(34) deaminase TadA [Phycisphaeraceae bacterium]|nr:tRNA adenosine(34) deaminase TadA [Phycisphaeraceae bacterium]
MANLRAARTTGDRVEPFDLLMMERAIALAQQATLLGEVPVGAVVFRGRDIVAEGFNRRESTKDPTAHAEMVAIAEAGRRLSEWRLNDCTLVVTLEPCPMCAGALVNARIGRVIYGARDPKAGACESLYRIPTDERLNHRVEMIGGVMADACGRLLTDFFRHRRRERRSGSHGLCA